MIFFDLQFLSILVHCKFGLTRSIKHQYIGFNQYCIQINPNLRLKKYFLPWSISEISLKSEICLILPQSRSWFYHMNVLKNDFFDATMKLSCIFYELGQKNTEKYEKSNLGVLRQKSNKVAMVHRIQESSLEFQRVSYEIARSSWSSMSAF